jgi:hypothetical protein
VRACMLLTSCAFRIRQFAAYAQRRIDEAADDDEAAAQVNAPRAAAAAADAPSAADAAEADADGDPGDGAPPAQPRTQGGHTGAAGAKHAGAHANASERRKRTRR